MAEESYFDRFHLSQTPRQWRENVLRGLMAGVVLLCDYALMLVVMTFNVGLILAVVFGAMAGTVREYSHGCMCVCMYVYPYPWA